MRRLHHLALLALPLFAACATTPTPLQGSFTVLEPRDVVDESRVGEPVRWGGPVIAVEPESDRTCMQILARELSGSARPRDRDVSQGRFVACRAGFYDPEVFEPGREVTVVGRIAAITQRPVGEYSYAMPEVAADAIYLWPQRRAYPPTYSMYDPWSPWSPWPYSRWGWGIGGSFGPVYIHHHHHPRPPVRPPVRPPPRGRE
jgi:outer membrane lipoprotein